MYTIMIIEGNDLFRNTLKDILHENFRDIRILEADTGEDALKQLDGKHPDLVFVEVKLSGQNGLLIAGHLKSRYPEGRIIIISAFDSPEYREAAEDLGIDHFFSKKTTKPADITRIVKADIAEAG
jgi:two-component system, response regulator YesN